MGSEQQRTSERYAVEFLADMSEPEFEAVDNEWDANWIAICWFSSLYLGASAMITHQTLEMIYSPSIVKGCRRVVNASISRGQSFLDVVLKRGYALFLRALGLVLYVLHANGQHVLIKVV